MSKIIHHTLFNEVIFYEYYKEDNKYDYEGHIYIYKIKTKIFVQLSGMLLSGDYCISFLTLT